MRRRTATGEASSASWSSKIDERMRAIVPSSSSTRSLIRAATSGVRLLQRAADPVQRQAGGEDPLDDVVVQVAGDAVAVRLDLQPALALLRAGQLEDDGGLGRERRQQLEVVGGERLAARGAHDREQAPPGACPSGAIIAGPKPVVTSTAAGAFRPSSGVVLTSSISRGTPASCTAAR